MTKGVLVTGASRGIGAAIAEHLASQGFRVGCVSRSGTVPAHSIRCDELGDLLIPLKADVCDRESMDAAVTEFCSEGDLVGLVSNAGAHIEGRAADLPIKDWEDQYRINATSVLICAQAVFEQMRRDGGLIVNIGSFFDRLGVKKNIAYCASKAAVAAMTRVMAVEWAQFGIRALTVAPGYVVTDLNRDAMTQGPLRAYLDKRIPAGEPADADDIGRLIAGLYQVDSRFLTGETIYVDGAQGVAH